MFRQPGDKGKQEGIIMVHQHYGTQTVNRGAVMPGMLVKHKVQPGPRLLMHEAVCIFTVASNAPTPKICWLRSI